MKLDKFKGIIVAMNSCYDSNGAISTHAVKKLTRFLIDKGVSGLYVGGSTGEGFLQTVNERKKVLEAVMEENAGRVTVIAQVGSISTRESMEIAQHAEGLHVDAISAVPPFYYKVSEKGAENHWMHIIESTSLPFIIYHIPLTTGFHISMNLFQRMVAHEQVIGLKITTPSSYELQQFKEVGGNDFIVFNGPDEQYLAGRIMGADAGIGGIYGAMPELFLKIEQSYTSGNLTEARKWQFIVNGIITDILKLPTYAALKEIVKLRGVDCGMPRLPIEPLTNDTYPKVEKLHKKIMEAVKQK
ncbi:N-acetylneuraminate lyase [Virgibacillus subterraneus]|uniref:N-acetylneuraminate lyase n=1 Tax=Virgibacillus subterraneus TaxID=621109 RepID=A0A1H9G6E2_9BACI|nr:dihydrodipicolinate synthase family protein [Virgibacillus subterraneus]SEQ45613.1 N-acetylneuraminate lyase [Virgibacillus subterraneus]